MIELLGNCNCNDDYKKIRKKINEEQKKYKFCYVQGPTARCNKSSIYIFKW